MSLDVREGVPLAPHTTLGLGGPARFFAEAADEAAVVEAVRWASRRGVPLHPIGGGSNLVVADRGVEGLVLRVALRGLAVAKGAGEAVLTVGAGEPWDGVVARAVSEGLAGLECLSGIPGLAGATPIQNVGAYGQEVAETIRAVRAFDRRDLDVVELPPLACGFAYRDSVFKRQPDRFVVLGVTFALRSGGTPALRYAELEQAMAARPEPPTLGRVRDEVLSLRRSKSMVIDPEDENRRSAGSFFTNPILAEVEAEAVVDRALAAGLVTTRAEVPRWPAGQGRTKLAAGWLIERAGIAKGLRRGTVGVSSRHALALVHHGGGSTAELLGLAREVREVVRARFGVTLMPEPVLLGVGL